MTGLCQSCNTSNVELELHLGSIVCKACVRRRKICDEYDEMEKNGTLGEKIDI